jgi:hypothetical membrane protein
MTHTTASPTIARHPRAGRRPTSTGALLNLAVATGPFFALVSAIQIVTRDGFDLRRHPLSQLATGNLGVIQMANFTLAGVGVVCLAVALRRLVTAGTGRRWLARLVAGFGLGLIAAGVFPMDPEYGFPAGTPDGPAAQLSWHGVAHAVAAATAYTALAAACIVYTVRRARERAILPAVLSAAAALVFLLPVVPAWASIQIAINGLVGFTWTTAVAVGLRRGYQAAEKAVEEKGRR